MANRTHAQIIADIGTKLANNTSGDITPQDVREIVTDIADSTKRPGLTDCTGTLYISIVGDSMSTENMGGEGREWGYRMLSKSAFAGRTLDVENIAVYGAGTSGDVADVASYIATRPPSAGDVHLVTYMKGTNDFIVATGDGVDDFNDWKDRFEDWLDAVYAMESSGGRVIILVMTTTGRPYPDSGAGSAFELCRQMQNAYLRKNEGILFDFLYDHAADFVDNTDTTFFADSLHHTWEGNERIACKVNQGLEAGGFYNLTLGQPAVVGAADSQVLSNASRRATATVYSKPQVVAESVLTDGTTVNWDLDEEQIARVVLGGNRTIANPTNMKSGGFFELTIEQDETGSRTPTWGDAYKGLPTLNTSAYRRHSLLFRCYDDATMLCVANNSYDGTPEEEPGEGDIVIESFADVGASGRTLQGTAPNLLNTPGGNWSDGGNGSNIVIPSGNPGYATTSHPTPAIYVETSESNATIEQLMRYVDNDASGVQGIVVRYTDGSNYWIFGANGNGGITIWKKESGSYTNYDYSFTYDNTPGVLLKVVMTSVDMKFYIDGTLIRTDTNSFNRTATKHGIGGINLGSNKARWHANFKVTT